MKPVRERPISLSFLRAPVRRGAFDAPSILGARRPRQTPPREGQSTVSRTEGAEAYLIDRGVGAPRPILQDASRSPDVRETPRCFGRSLRRLARNRARRDRYSTALGFLPNVTNEVRRELAMTPQPERRRRQEDKHRHGEEPDEGRATKQSPQVVRPGPGSLGPRGDPFDSHAKITSHP